MFVPEHLVSYMSQSLDLLIIRGLLRAAYIVFQVVPVIFKRLNQQPTLFSYLNVVKQVCFLFLCHSLMMFEDVQNIRQVEVGHNSQLNFGLFTALGTY